MNIEKEVILEFIDQRKKENADEWDWLTAAEEIIESL